MLCLKTYSSIPDEARGCIIVIGNFDGVHLGHRALLEHAREIANKANKKLAVLTFEPHPRQLFRPDEPPCRITPPALKADKMQEQGVDVLFSIDFNWEFASLSAQDFIQNVLIQGLDAAHVIVGYDFRFGQLRKGKPETIRDAGIPVTIIDEVTTDGDEDLSSSRIRQLLRHGKIAEANTLLGWDWEIRGKVFKGDQRGRELGYPTANMKLDQTIHPAYGVYAAFVRLEGESTWRMGATNIGIRPMFAVPTAQVETYIFDFNEEIYEKILCVRPIKRLRGEAKFNSLEDLKAQMVLDCAQARKILENAG